MKIKYRVKEFNPNKISVGDWVYGKGWYSLDNVKKVVYQVCGIVKDELRITVDGEEYDIQYPIKNMIKINTKDKDKYEFHK